MAKTRRPITHEHLRAIVKNCPQDWEGYGEQPRHYTDADGQRCWGNDCSMGCIWYAELKGRLSLDWGVCTNPASHRCGLLTFEHQGCMHFEGED